LGFPLYATFGVNSLATFEFCLAALILIDLFFVGGRPLLEVVVKAAGFFVLVYLIVFTLSRGALGSLVFFYLAATVGLSLFKPKQGFLLLAIVSVTGLVGTTQFGDSISQAWSEKAFLAGAVLGNGDIHDFSSGRDVLVLGALQDIEANPLTSSGFNGYRVSKDVKGDDVHGSPHNQYLLMFWKAGLPTGICLLAFLLYGGGCMVRVAGPLRQMNVYHGIGLIFLTYFLWTFLSWDILLVPNIGALSFFLFGGMVGCDERAERPTKQPALLLQPE
jgi:hypothetical protein